MVLRARSAAFCVICAVFALGVTRPVTLQSQTLDSGAVFRVFLKSGAALPSYGESALVGDRVVFTLIVGAADARMSVQLMSLPSDRVDLVRTQRYADAMRARHYAATRGEVDYATMTQEVQRTLSELTSIADPKKRLALAEDARRRLLTWSAGTYGYRAADVRELLGLFDEVIAELRTAAGERQFSVDLRTGPDDLKPEPLMAVPTLAESVELALEAAKVADGESDRLAILRAAEAFGSSGSLPENVNSILRRELESEVRVAASYENLFRSARTRAEAARKRGDVAGIETAINDLRAGDEALGGRRRQSVDGVVTELNAILDAARTYRAALDRYARVRGALLQYERTIRPVMSGFDGLVPVLTAVRDIRYTAYERLERAGARLTAFRSTLRVLAAPSDLADVHATLDSALKMADYACARRRLGMAIMSETIDREASSAAAGAMMLAANAREQLVARLYPPKIQ